ncbi:hypothetical protein IQ06DRAFT_298411 [Phaeosphaeriaceae sp. SRC1lsM3a]|nr:hypothetical protein IQ06DRAFT_298411 [Stagonospora sp. SRC1lsM3a]
MSPTDLQPQRRFGSHTHASSPAQVPEKQGTIDSVPGGHEAQSPRCSGAQPISSPHGLLCHPVPSVRAFAVHASNSCQSSVDQPAESLFLVRLYEAGR